MKIILIVLVLLLDLGISINEDDDDKNDCVAPEDAKNYAVRTSLAA